MKKQNTIYTWTGERKGKPMNKKIYLVCVAVLVIVAAAMTYFTFTAHAATMTNQEIYNAMNWTEPEILQYYIGSPLPEGNVILETSKEITEGLTTDREKAKAIHTWVAENIWYDHDWANRELTVANATRNVGPYEVLELRRAVCGEYSYLNIALLKAVGIPARRIIVTVVSTNGHHASYQAFVDGKWIICDSTWDCNNRYENGEFGEQQPANNPLQWFDVSLSKFSETFKMADSPGDIAKPDIRDGWFYVDGYKRYRISDGKTEDDLLPRNITANDVGIIIITIGSPMMLVGDTQVELDVPAQIIDGSTMVPMRAIFEALGATVTWNTDGIYQYIGARKGDMSVSMRIGEYELTIGCHHSDPTIGYFVRETLTLPVPPQIIDGRTMVPARAVADAFGCDVQWEPNTMTVTITVNGATTE